MSAEARGRSGSLRGARLRRWLLYLRRRASHARCTQLRVLHSNASTKDQFNLRRLSGELNERTSRLPTAHSIIACFIRDPSAVSGVKNTGGSRDTQDIQAADAQTILNAASARMLRVSYGVM